MNQFPTLNGLELLLNEQKDLLDKAVTEKAFRKCAELKSKITELQSKHDELLKITPLCRLTSDDLKVRKDQAETLLNKA